MLRRTVIVTAQKRKAPVRAAAREAIKGCGGAWFFGRAVAGVLDLSWVRSEFALYYPKIGRPSIDPTLMIRMLIVGYVFAIRSERLLCQEVKVNLAYRWFCGLSIEDRTQALQQTIMEF